jgi:hypothetical protein
MLAGGLCSPLSKQFKRKMLQRLVSVFLMEENALVSRQATIVATP